MRAAVIVLLAAVVAVAGVAPAAVAGGAASADVTTQVEADCEYPITLTDATGEEIELEEVPESVVALQASDLRTAVSIGAADVLAGAPNNSATADLDVDAADVTDGFELDVERIVELDPDVVLAANVTRSEDVAQLRDAGLEVYHFGAADSLEDVGENALVTGQLTGECAGAEEAVVRMNDSLETVETALEGEDRPLAYYEMGEGQTAGSGTFQHEVLTTAGLENLAERAGIEQWGTLNAETIVAEDPEWIVYPDRTDEPQVAEAVEGTTAYREGNLVAVDDNRMSQPTPQVVHVIETIVEAAHPEAYEAAQGGESDDGPADDGEMDGDDGASDDGSDDGSDASDDGATDGESDDGNDTSDSGDADGSSGDGDDEDAANDGNGNGTDGNGDDGGGTDDGGDSVPGFGVAGAVVAVLSALGIGVRRR